MTLALDPQGFPLWQGELLDLPPKERAVLSLLIRQRPQVVSKQAFADAAWSGRPMSDESLARCVSRLRRVLPGVEIEAVYGEGYRMPGQVPATHARLLAAAQAAPQAVETHLHARALAQRRTPSAMQGALALLHSLVDAHPLYAPARVTLAETLAAAAAWGLRPGPAFIDEGLAQLAQAQRIDAACPGVATCRAWLLDFAWRFDEAEAEYARALDAAPTDPETLFLHGWHRLAIGQTAAAITRLREAVALQPYSALFRTMLARALTHDGQWPAAQREAEFTCREHPDSSIAQAHRVGLLAHLAPGAAVASEAWRLAEQRDAPPYALSVLSYALARCGEREAARAVIDACLACSASTACSAILHVAACLALGDADRAVRLIDAAFDARCALLPMVLREPANAALHSHPAVAPVLAAVFGG
jgi:DNA-binding winged helix-turn-helix (wHTH) protein